MYRQFWFLLSGANVPYPGVYIKLETGSAPHKRKNIGKDELDAKIPRKQVLTNEQAAWLQDSTEQEPKEKEKF